MSCHMPLGYLSPLGCFHCKLTNFPGGWVVKNPLSNAGDADFSSAWETKIPQASGLLSPHTAPGERVPQPRPDRQTNAPTRGADQGKQTIQEGRGFETSCWVKGLKTGRLSFSGMCDNQWASFGDRPFFSRKGKIS